MKYSADIMGMPVRIEIVDENANERDVEEVFKYLREVDEQFSTYKNTSEVERINSGKLKPDEYSDELKEVLRLADLTQQETNGYFDIWRDGKLDPSGIVKGYAIRQAASLLQRRYRNFYIEIAGDVQICGLKNGQKWKTGIKNPFSTGEIIKVFELTDCGIATSGTYARGSHIYNPLTNNDVDEIASITVIASNVYDADRMATAAFAMGDGGIEFIETLEGYEGYMVKSDNTGVMTSGLSKFVK